MKLYSISSQLGDLIFKKLCMWKQNNYFIIMICRSERVLLKIKLILYFRGVLYYVNVSFSQGLEEETFTISKLIMKI